MKRNYTFRAKVYRHKNYFFSGKELIFLRQGTTFSLARNYFLPGGRGADRDDSDTGRAAVVRPVVVERCGVGEDAGLVVVDVVAEVVVRHLLVLALIVHPALRQICKKQQTRFTNSAISTPVGGFTNY